MTYKELSEVNTTKGVYTLFTYVAEVVPIFVPMMLFSFYIIIVLGTYFSEKRLTTKGHFSSSCAVAGYATFILALTLSLVPGLINLPTLAITFMVAILGTIFLFLAKRDR